MLRAAKILHHVGCINIFYKIPWTAKLHCYSPSFPPKIARGNPFHLEGHRRWVSPMAQTTKILFSTSMVSPLSREPRHFTGLKILISFQVDIVVDIVVDMISTSRIIPVSKWFITMVRKSPNWCCSPSKWFEWLINGVTNHLLTGMILQVGGGVSWFSSFAALFVGRFPFSLIFFKGVETTTYQLMENWWFGARWFGFLGSPYERDWLLLNWSGWIKNFTCPNSETKINTTTVFREPGDQGVL